MKKQLTMQNEYSRQLAIQSENHRRMIHDFRQHLRLLSMLAENIQATPDTRHKQEELLSYLKDMTNITRFKDQKPHDTFSDNPAVDALLQYYYRYATGQQIETDFQWLSMKNTLSDIECCTVLGNLLENAIDACQNLPKDQVRKIKLYTKETEYLLFICIENTYNGFIRKKGLAFLSQKTDFEDAGIGIDSVRAIIERHNGTLDIYPDEHIFRVGITLPVER